jgi:hypothetical protein
MRGLRIALALLLLPLAAGQVVVTYQDAVMTHLPTKAATVEMIRDGQFPAVNPYASLGQPLAGNPNFGTFFPDVFAFLVLPLPVAFGLRFALAFGLAFLGARRWARAEGAARGPAEVAAWAFALSGVYVSAWRFFNSALAVALVPWMLAAAARLVHRADADGPSRRRAIAQLGLWGGLEILAGEPVVALLGFVVTALRVLAANRRLALPLAGGLALAAALAAPQIAATAQVYPTSTRSLAPFDFGSATGTSVHPIRLLEQAAPFPLGRPDLTGEGGFTGHAFHDGHPPYLWTLHLGWATVVLLLLFARPLAVAERGWWLLAAGAAALAFGHYLPGAKLLHPLLSLDGRLRFPVKWWYVVALALVPMVARAATRWTDGDAPSPSARWTAPALLLVFLVVAAWMGRTPLALLGLAASLVAAILLLQESRAARPRPAGRLAVLIALPLLASLLPLFRALLDRPPDAPPRFAGGRVLERLRIEPHPAPHSPGADPPERLVRDAFRRAPRELWALSGALSQMPYAYDRDPDGVYFDGDRVMGKAIDALPWPRRVPLLRMSGIEYVVSDEPLPAPFERLVELSAAHGVVLYHLASPVPPVRVATRVLPARTAEAAAHIHGTANFDPRRDVVMYDDPSSHPVGTRRLAHADVTRQEAAALTAQVSAPEPAVLVWSRTFLPGWRATVDGVAAPVLLADGHLVGIQVPTGAHTVTVDWDTRPIVAGAVLAALAAAAIAGLTLVPRSVRAQRRGGVEA